MWYTYPPYVLVQHVTVRVPCPALWLSLKSYYYMIYDHYLRSDHFYGINTCSHIPSHLPVLSTMTSLLVYLLVVPKTFLFPAYCNITGKYFTSTSIS